MPPKSTKARLPDPRFTVFPPSSTEYVRCREYSTVGGRRRVETFFVAIPRSPDSTNDATFTESPPSPTEYVRCRDYSTVGGRRRVETSFVAIPRSPSPTGNMVGLAATADEQTPASTDRTPTGKEEPVSLAGSPVSGNQREQPEDGDQKYKAHLDETPSQERQKIDSVKLEDGNNTKGKGGSTKRKRAVQGDDAATRAVVGKARKVSRRNES